jgi:peptidoglycan/LPS O-acetylase OafA/YrhL
MKIEYFYYLVFGLLLIIVATEQGRSLIASCYYAVDKKYFELIALSKTQSASKAERIRYKLVALLIVLGLFLPIIIFIGIVYFYRFKNRGFF